MRAMWQATSSWTLARNINNYSRENITKYDLPASSTSIPIGLYSPDIGTALPQALQDGTLQVLLVLFYLYFSN